ncbi:MAG TPA: CBS domain-containing protein [Blastocatellia bacterium]|nr:CBS domain-containing protein [Blastocatellia bacterium]
MRRYDSDRSNDAGNVRRNRAEQPPNFGSARSDYGDLAYGGSLDKRGLDRDRWDRGSRSQSSRHAETEERGFLDRAGDEIRSWFGDEEAERRRQMDDLRDWREHGRDYADDQHWQSRQQPRLRDQRFTETGRGARPDEYNRRVAGPTVREVMTRDVATVYPDDKVERAARLMRECDCGAIPVVSNSGRLLGMITDRDIVVRLVAYGEDLDNCRVGDFMTTDVFSCNQRDDLDSVRELMSRNQIRRVPVVTDHGQIEGIVTQGDLARFARSHAGSGARRLVGDMVGNISEPLRRR